MEADSTTIDGNSKTKFRDCFPFPTSPGNFRIYTDLTCSSGEKNLEIQIVERLQDFGLLPKSFKCPTDKPDCKLICRNARVIDRVQWFCEGCGKRQPIRSDSFFMRIQCSLLQALQMVLAWCEDAECVAAAEHFGVKPRVAITIYDKLDELAVREHNKRLLGGEGSVVLTEMYPDCLTRLSPDTTDQAHVHKIVMLADTKHIPTAYKLHVIRNDIKKQSTNTIDSELLRAEVEEVISSVTSPQSLLVHSASVPAPRGALSLRRLGECDRNMQHFLNTRIWRQAVTLCSASRELCAGAPPPRAPPPPCAGAPPPRAPPPLCAGAPPPRAPPPPCAGAVQRYLDTALFRLRHSDDFYKHVLRVIASEYTGDRDVEDYDRNTV